ncbi:toxin-antitoxin system, toxin component [Streptomyces sp. B21-083]|uniref:toxin-antitoxin system, toxin component n=1 Tax=Streptomyces sp. B21-083 TaxID=3039410 RepID=UPI002FEEA52A
MRRLSSQLLVSLEPPDDDEGVLPAIGRALSDVRGRPVRLRSWAFPPTTVSGLWIDRDGHDVIAYEENTDPEHQLVIIGHETWHMFQGHCGSHTAPGPAASRALGKDAATALKDLAALVSDADDVALPKAERTDAVLHIAARTDTASMHDELEAEHFGIRFATDVQAALAEARSSADSTALAGRIQAVMAHRFRRT